MKHILHAQVDNLPKLLINTHLKEASYTKSRFLDFSYNESFILNLQTGEKTSWSIEGCTSLIEQNTEETVWVYGSDFEGVSLFDFINSTSEEKAYTLIKTLLDFYEKEDLQLPGPHGIFISPQADKALILPSELWLRCLSQDSEQTYSTLYGRFIHPMLEGESATLHFFGNIFYYLFANKNPAFKNETTSGIHQDIFDKNIIPLKFQNFSLKEEIAQFIDSCITQGSSNKKITLSLDDLKAILPQNYEDCFNSNQINTEEFIKNKTKFLQKQKRRVTRHRFFRRNESIFKVASCCLALLLIVGAFIAIEMSKRPDTKGMTPQEVISKFYYSFSDMDQTWMRACTTENAGDYYEQTVLNVSVNSAMRQSLERKRAVYTPGEWANLPHPEETQVFGITNLTLKEEDLRNPQRAKFTVHFYLLVPQLSQALADTVIHDIEYAMSFYPLIGFEITDEVELKNIDSEWKISSILALSNKSIPVDPAYYFLKYEQGKPIPEILWAPSEEEIKQGLKKLKKHGEY